MEDRSIDVAKFEKIKLYFTWSCNNFKKIYFKKLLIHIF